MGSVSPSSLGRRVRTALAANPFRRKLTLLTTSIAASMVLPLQAAVEVTCRRAFGCPALTPASPSFDRAGHMREAPPGAVEPFVGFWLDRGEGAGLQTCGISPATRSPTCSESRERQE